MRSVRQAIFPRVSFDVVWTSCPPLALCGQGWLFSTASCLAMHVETTTFLNHILFFITKN